MPDDTDTTVSQPLRPIGICARCRVPVRSLAQIGKKCTRMTAADRRCPGLIRTAIEPKDWAECQLCHGTGRVAGASCARCDGDGWTFTAA